MAHALRALRWKSISWTLGIAVLLSVAARVSAREVRVGVLIDGPAARDGVSATALEQAAQAVYGDGLVLAITPQTRLDGNWSAAKLNAALDRLEADPQVDVVVTLGFAASHLVAHRARLPKPPGRFICARGSRFLLLECVVLAHQSGRLSRARVEIAFDEERSIDTPDFRVRYPPYDHNQALRKTLAHLRS